MIRVERLQKKWPRFALEIDRLEIGEGEYFVVLGPSGAGKTVLLLCLAGIARPDRGRILFADRDVTKLPPEKRSVGWVSQNNTLFPHLTVMQNIRFARRYAAGQIGNLSNFDSRVDHLIEMLDIGHFVDRPPGDLSGGEAQRVMLARALALGPRVLLLDEPLRGLDPMTQERLRDEIARLHHELGTTTFHITHDHVEARALADRIAVIRDGRIEQIGPADEVFERPATPFVARFTGAENVFALSDATLDSSGEPTPVIDRAVLAEGAIPATATHIAVRPEHVEVHPAEAPRDSFALNSLRLEGTIESIVQQGGWLRAVISCQNTRWIAFVSAREAARHALLPGRKVVVAVARARVHVPGQ